MLWMLLRLKAVTPTCLNYAFAARSSPLDVFRWEMLRDLTVGSLLALMIWLEAHTCENHHGGG
jgi:hypothetical protein